MILEDVYRDVDRLLRMGARPSDLLLDAAPWVVASYRVGNAIASLPRWARLPLLALHRPVQVMLSTVTGTSLPAQASIGGGLHLSHATQVIISPEARIGRDCELAQGTTIGVGGRAGHRGAPVIGDRVYIGPGAKVFGPIRVGNDVAIGANAVVCEDVPDGAVVAGVPAKIVSMRGSRDFVLQGRRMPDLAKLFRELVRSLDPQKQRLLKAA